MTALKMQQVGAPPLPAPVDPATRPLFYRTKEVPRTAVSGKGIYVTLDDGSTLIDAVGGAAVNGIGNGNERVVKACMDQMQNLAYVYSMQFTTKPAEELGDFLIQASNGVFQSVNFVAGGSEAVESALKLVRQYWWEKGNKERVHFIGRNMSYHGNTMGALSVGHHPTRRGPYAALMNESVFHHVSPANFRHYALSGESEQDYSTRLATELEAKIVELGPDTVSAFFAEPMVGATQGCMAAPAGYWPKCKAVCEKYGVLMVFDEVMSGMWRMGTMFAFQSICENTTPDILTCAKGLGSGYVSIGAVFLNSKVQEVIRHGSGVWNSGFTYVGHPVACAGALEVQKIIKEEKYFERIAPLGLRLSSRLRSSLLAPGAALQKVVSDIRGYGLFWGVEYDIAGVAMRELSPRFATRVETKAFELGLVVLGLPGTTDGYSGDTVILAPAMICTNEEIDRISDLLVRASEAVYAEVVAELGAGKKAM